MLGRTDSRRRLLFMLAIFGFVSLRPRGALGVLAGRGVATSCSAQGRGPDDDSHR